MAVDPAVYISELNTALPTSADNIAEGDDNLRHIKQVMINTIGQLDAAMTLDAATINGLPASIQAVDGRLTSEAARLDQADTDQNTNLNNNITNGDNAVRAEFAAADTVTYNNAMTDGNAYTDGEISTVVSNQAIKDGEQDAAITSINDAIADLTGSDTDLPAAKQYTDEQIILLRGQNNHSSNLTNLVLKGRIDDNESDIAQNASDIAALGSALTLDDIINALYPVGSIFITDYDRDLPSALKSGGRSWSHEGSHRMLYSNQFVGDFVWPYIYVEMKNAKDTGDIESKAVCVWTRTG